jgi:hypothetical protein
VISVLYSSDIGLLIFLIVMLSTGCLLGVGALVDVLKYRDLQRRLREERMKRDETGCG